MLITLVQTLLYTVPKVPKVESDNSLYAIIAIMSIQALMQVVKTLMDKKDADKPTICGSCVWDKDSKKEALDKISGTYRIIHEQDEIRRLRTSLDNEKSKGD